MATIPSPCSSWSAKQYILAALLGVLVAIAFVAAISISLAPAYISFSIANATMSGDDNGYYQCYYNFTLVANNTSRRTEVSYGSLSTQIWYSPAAWIPAEVNTMLPEWQPPRNATDVAIGAEYGQYNEAANATANTTDHRQLGTVEKSVFDCRRVALEANATANATVDDCQLGTVEKSVDCRVVVEAKVWFKYGLTTRPYTVTASCWHVNFFNGTGVPVTCVSS
uniref:Late embryogenesis abundant protein LEA-2 subgroup domain-containing protein n=1 Tax=Arundo donax TaxID=35708 RepID=A0A0A9BT84_ARUDO